MTTVRNEKRVATEPIPAFVIGYSDSSFANPHSVVFTHEPVFDADAFTFVGKEMDGIESKRHSTLRFSAEDGGFEFDPYTYNWFELGLKERSSVERIAISTKWFTGNQVRKVSVWLKDEVTGKETQVLDRVTLKPDSEQDFPVTPTVATECRVHCHHDGGITRMHLYGPAAEPVAPRENLLATATVSHVSNEHYGKPAQAIEGNRQVGHMLGWESARTGFGEQALFQLKEAATIDEIIADTYMHVFNSPLGCLAFALNNSEGKSNDDLMKLAPRWKIRYADGKEEIPEKLNDFVSEEKYANGKEQKMKVVIHHPDGSPWKPLLPFSQLHRDTYNRFKKLESIGPVTHVLFMYFPNGGIHGLKFHGKKA